MDDLKIGNEVLILRSNGEMQRCVITRLAEERGCALVEWKEEDVIKAKEVMIESLVIWNQPNKKTHHVEKGQRKTIFKELSPQKRKVDQENKPVITQDKNKNQADSKRKSISLSVAKLMNNRKSVAGNLQPKKTEEIARNANVVEIDFEEDELIPQNSQHYAFYKMIEDYKYNLNCNINYDISARNNHPISVCIRKRPMNKKEIEKNEIDIITVVNSTQMLIHEGKHRVNMTKYLENHNFTFDYTFNEECHNDLIYKTTTQPLVECIFEGGMATCFAYGQTGSGKTYTMGGNYFTSNSSRGVDERGICDYAARDILLKLKKTNGHFLTVSVFEIYGSKVFDLLNSKKMLRVMEDGQGKVQLCELKEFTVSAEKELVNHINQALKQRTAGQTSANENSSRSHAIIQFTVYKRVDPRRKEMVGKLSLIDLAGNERGADTTDCDRFVRMEGAEINKSLLALKECIRALGRKNAHLPFRSSKLTQVLKDSFIAENAKTCMIATVSPSISCCENTLNTLHYADRVKQLGRKSSLDSNDCPVENDIEPEPIDQENMKKEIRELHELICKDEDSLRHTDQMLIQNFSKMSLNDYILNLSNLVEKKLNLYEELNEKIYEYKQFLE